MSETNKEPDNKMLTAECVTLNAVNPPPVSCKLRVLARPDGSASFTQGATTVIAAVYGPAEVRTHRELIDRAVVEVVYQPKVGQCGPEGRAIEALISSVCEAMVITTMHPHTAFTIVVQEVQVGCSLLQPRVFLIF